MARAVGLLRRGLVLAPEFAVLLAPGKEMKLGGILDVGIPGGAINLKSCAGFQTAQLVFPVPCKR